MNLVYFTTFSDRTMEQTKQCAGSSINFLIFMLYLFVLYFTPVTLLSFCLSFLPSFWGYIGCTNAMLFCRWKPDNDT